MKKIRIMFSAVTILILMSIIKVDTKAADIAKLYWPVRNASGESITSITPGRGFSNSHKGIDVDNASGAGWYAAYEGTIFRVFNGCISDGYDDKGHQNCDPKKYGRYPQKGIIIDGKEYKGDYCNYGFGNGIVIESEINGAKYYFSYAHMNEVNPLLEEGQTISAGTYLGTVGNRGYSFGTHAHFASAKGGIWGEPINNDPTSSGCQFSYNYGQLITSKDMLGTWTGSYDGYSGSAAICRKLDLNIYDYDNDKFYGIATINSNTNGNYYFEGEVDSSTGNIKFSGEKWRYNPSDFGFAEFEGELDTSTYTYSGNVDSSSSKVFSLKRTSTDYTNPATSASKLNNSYWIGEYDGHSGYTVVNRDLKTNFSKVTDGSVEGMNKFFPSNKADKSYGRTGSYYFSGTYDESISYIEIQGYDWIKYPEGDEDSWSFVELKGYYDPASNKIIGYSGEGIWEMKPSTQKEFLDDSYYEKLFSQYTISFNGNGATSGSMKDITGTLNKATKLPKNTFDKKGYKFKGWKYTVGGNSYTVKDNASINISAFVLRSSGTQTLKLTAQWEKDPSYGVKKAGTTITDMKSKAKYVVVSSKNKTVKYYRSTNKNAKTISIPATISYDGITYKVTEVDAKALKGNKKATTIKVGKNVTKIGDEAFSGCTALTSLTIGSNVTTIGNKAIYSCSSLTKLTLPINTYKLGEQFVGNCKNLNSLTVKNAKMTKKTLTNGACSGIGKNVTVKVPKSKKTEYIKLFQSKGLSKKVKVE